MIVLSSDNVNEYLLEIAKDNNSIDGELVYNIISQLDAENEDELLNEALEYLKNNSIDVVENETEEFIFEGKTDNYVKDYLNQISLYRLLSAEEECELSKRIINANDAKIMILENPSDELSLIIERGDDAKERLINHNLRLVVNVAKRYISPGVDFMDLVQEGNMGLMIAAGKYDYRYGYRFSTYAYNWIRHSISNMLRNSNEIRLPLNVQNDLSIIKRKTSELEQEFGSEKITPEMIYDSLDGSLSLKKIKELLCLNISVISLDAKTDDSDDSRDLHEAIPCEEYNEKFDYPIGWEKLSEREQDIFLMFYRDNITLANIGLKYNLSSERIRQIKDRTKRKLEFYSKNG